MGEKFHLDSHQDIEDFTIGCTFFGTGGGGDPKFGQQMLLEVFEKGKKISIVNGDSLSEDEWVVCPYLMGTSGKETKEQREEKEKYGLTSRLVSNMPMQATKLLLSEHNVKSLSAVIAYEIGGAATASALATAAALEVVAVDADFVGRSVPEIIQMLPVIHGVDLCPIASADAYGNEVVIRKTRNYQMVERIGKALSSASCGLVGQATLLSQMGIIRPHMLKGTLSKALAVGRAIRENKGKMGQLMVALKNLAQSQMLFEGEISEFIGGDEEGYYVGSIVINGAKGAMKIWFKNESLIAWLNDKVYLTCPDLISLIDGESGAPFINSALKKGMKVAVIGTPSAKEWHTPLALKAIDPRHFGFDFASHPLCG